MTNDTLRDLRRPPPLQPSPFETGDYTVPDALDARLVTPDELLLPTDFEDGESTTITRHRAR